MKYLTLYALCSIGVIVGIFCIAYIIELQKADEG